MGPRPRLLLKSNDETFSIGTSQIDGHDIPIAAATIELERGRTSHARLEVNLIGGLDLELPADVTVLLAPGAPGLVTIGNTRKPEGDARQQVRFVVDAGQNMQRAGLLTALDSMPAEAFDYFVAWASGSGIQFPDGLGGFRQDSRDSIAALRAAAAAFLEALERPEGLERP